MQARESVSLRQVGVGTFFVFRDLEEMLCVLWALSLIECVTVGALKLPVPLLTYSKPTLRKTFC